MFKQLNKTKDKLRLHTVSMSTLVKKPLYPKA